MKKLISCKVLSSQASLPAEMINKIGKNIIVGGGLAARHMPGMRRVVTPTAFNMYALIFFQRSDYGRDSLAWELEWLNHRCNDSYTAPFDRLPEKPGQAGWQHECL